MLITTASLILLIVALLAVPVSLRFHLSSDDAVKNTFELTWAFGFVRTRVPLPVDKSTGKRENVKRKRWQDEHAAGKKKAARKKTGRRVLSLIRKKYFRRRIVNYLNDLWTAIRKEDVNLRLRLGLGDPADTGQLWAFLGPLSGALNNIQYANIDIEPEFVDETLEFDASGRIRLVPIQLIGLTIALLLSPVIWQGIHQLRLSRK